MTQSGKSLWRRIGRKLGLNRDAYWEQSAATSTLHNAWSYLYVEYWRKASSQTRGYILPDTQEALDILHKLAKDSLERSLEL